MPKFQKTLKHPVHFSGIGVHSGRLTRLTAYPAAIDEKISFACQTEDDKPLLRIPAELAYVNNTLYCTELAKDGYVIKTVEHIMAAIAALAIDNLYIEIEGDELPILDGGAYSYFTAFEEAGLCYQEAPRRYLRILQHKRLDFCGGYAEFLPLSHKGASLKPALRPLQYYDITIDFSSKHIGRQNYVFELSAAGFKEHIARARTFGFKKDAQLLRKQGLIKGANLDNSIVIGENDEILNEQPLFYADEFVRHKLLDAVGDTALLGYPFWGAFRSYCSGHRYNIELSRELLQDKNSYEIIML